MKAKKHILVVVLCIFMHSVAFSQVKFEKVYGSTGYDYGYSVTQMLDTGYAVVGATSSFGSGNTDVYLLKTDSMGVAVSHRTFGGINIDQAFSVKSTSVDSGLIIAGYTNSLGYGGYDMYVIKTNKNCDSTWTKTYGGTNWDFAYSIEPTSDGGYIIAGGTYSFGSGGEDMYLVKINSNGDTLWTKTYGGAFDDEAKSVKQTTDGGYILTGISKSFGDTNGDIFTIKTDSMGDTLWTYKYQGSLDDNSYDVIEDNTGAGYIIAGKVKSVAFGFQATYIRINLSGAFLSVFFHGGTSTPHDGLNAITQTADGRFGMIGYTNSYGAGLSDIVFYLEKPIGTYVGSVTFGGTKMDKGYCIKNTMDGGFIICGTALSFSTFERIYLIKTDSLGTASGSIISVTTEVDNSIGATDSNFLIYPNPSNNEVFIQANSAIKSEFVVTIYDVLGKKVFSQKVDSSSSTERISINTEYFQSGIYTVNILSQNYLSNQKLIIQKQ